LAGTLFFVPLFRNFDPQDIDIISRVEEYLPQEFQDELPIPPVTEEVIEMEDVQVDESIPLAVFSFNDFGVTFSYPSGWDIEVETYAVSFYEPGSFTYLYVGEDLVDPGTTADDVAASVLESLQEEAQEGSVELLSSTPYVVPIEGEAQLNLIEWIEQDGYYTWAYDLEIVSGESNIFFFLSGEDPDEIEKYGELLDIIAASLTRNPVEIMDEDA
jgi:hypothetical protein